MKTKINLNNRVANSARNTMVGVIAQCFQMLATIVCRMIFVRIFAEEYLGVSGLFSNILSLLAVTELGISSAVTYELYQTLAKGDTRMSAALMRLYRIAYTFVGMTIAVLGLVIMPFVNILVSKSEVITESTYVLYGLYLLGTVFTYFFSYKATIIDASQQNYITTIINVSCGIIRNIIQCVVIVITHNFLYYLMIEIAFVMVYNLTVSYVSNKMFPYIKDKDTVEIPKEIKKRMFNNARYLFVNNALGKMINATDNIIITALDGLATTGVNSNYALITSTLSLFTQKITLGLTGSIGNINATEEKEKRLELYYEVYLVYHWLFTWCAICMSFLIQDTVSIFFGAKYVMPFEIGVITAVNFMYVELQNCRATFHGTMGLFKYGRYTQAVSGVLNIFLSIYLGKKFGLFGILVATLISRLSIGWYLGWLTFKHGFESRVLPYYLRVIEGWIVSILAFALTWVFCKLIHVNSLVLDLIIRIIICIIVPNVFILVVNLRKDEYKRVSYKIKRFVGGKLKKN